MKVQYMVSAAVGMIVVLIALLSMVPTIITQEETATADASTWNFTGASGAESLLGLTPFVWIAAILLIVVGASFAIARGTGKS